MLFALVADWHPQTTAEQRDAALGRRAAWRYPEGTTVKSEYWSFGASPLIYAVFEAEDPKAVWQVSADWDDVFSVRIMPVITPDFGLANGQEVFARRPR